MVQIGKVTGVVSNPIVKKSTAPESMRERNEIDSRFEYSKRRSCECLEPGDRP